MLGGWGHALHHRLICLHHSTVDICTAIFSSDEGFADAVWLKMITRKPSFPLTIEVYLVPVNDWSVYMAHFARMPSKNARLLY